MNSASVAGGTAPLPEHSTFPDPQSPVAQEKFPDESWEQSVRAQNRPAQEAGAVIVLDSPFWSANPVAEIAAMPGFVRIPGQTVWSHLFDSLNVVANTPDKNKLETKIDMRKANCVNEAMN